MRGNEMKDYCHQWMRLLALALTITNAGCATLAGSLGTAAGTGALLGAGAGLIQYPGKKGEYRLKNILVGSAIGALVGTGAGFLGHEYFKTKEEEAYTRGKESNQQSPKDLNQFPTTDDQPTLLPPKTEAHWIPDQVRGNTFIPGHFEYIITQGARWGDK
jgi:hypothetical protein